MSAGCKNCYAEKMHKRLRGMKQVKYQHAFLGDVRTHKSSLSEPFKWKKPRMVFVNSMSDLFHEDVPFDFIDKVFAVMALTPQHTYQILTKRPDRMLEYLNVGESPMRNAALFDMSKDWIDPSPKGWKMPFPLPNVWLGTSVENQEQANKRIPHLMKCPAAVRFLSCEPLLGEVRIDKVQIESGYPFWPDNPFTTTYENRLRWVIAGGESGPNARPMHPDWARSLRDQCKEAGIPFFFKQWGKWAPTTAVPVRGTHTGGGIYFKPNGHYGNQGDWWDGNAAGMDKMGKKKAGNLLDGEQWLQFPSIKNLQSKITDQ